jgi:hypothetical protein
MKRGLEFRYSQMKTPIPLIIALTFSIGSCSQNETEANLVQKCFDNFTKCGDGVCAAKFLDSRTLTYYDNILDLTLTADSSTIAGLRFWDKYVVLRNRHTIPPDELRKMTGRNLFIHTMNSQKTPGRGEPTSEIEDIRVEGDSALAAVLENGKALEFPYRFYKENGQWKIDLTSQLPAANKPVTDVLPMRKMTEIEFIFDMLHGLSGKVVEPSIWIPVGK